MAACVPLRSDFDAEAVRALAEGSRDPAHTRRLLAPSAIDAGGSRSEAAAVGGVGLQTVRHRVMAFDARGPDGPIDGKTPGCPPAPGCRPARSPQGPGRAGGDARRPWVVRWRLVDLGRILFADHGMSVSGQTPSRVLRTMGYRKLSARPRHRAQDPQHALYLRWRMMFPGNRIPLSRIML